ncbi:uncharacterized protein LOC115891509 [Sitophilus oryzae]|uniref:Uncharacterized protein LOC115891509 n=1 Tax=Sitophilus oryzae TaxID=7048 RepID=A0A6J2YXB2_SITOR|nr:uncharacterized protein LOC115891509 [Sitophilus oryzae]
MYRVLGVNLFRVTIWLWFSTGVFGLRDVKIKVPQAVIKGREANLECSFDLENENLYSVKWYRGGFEFYRYTPTDLQKVKLFDVKGIKVKESESTERKIILEDVSRDISGPFSCEVTADKPSFFTAIQTAELQVVELPKKEPYITGLKHRYYTSEDRTFHANCTCEESYPSPNITWFINDLPIRGPHVMKHTFNRGSLITVVSTIRHHLSKKFYINGYMKVKCTVSLFDVYLRSVEKNVDLFKKRRRNHHPDRMVISTLPPPKPEDLYYDAEDEKPEKEFPRTILSFFSPSEASSNLTSLLLTTLLLVIIFFSNCR